MESFIIQDFKIFAPIRIGGNSTFAYLDSGASGNMIAASEADGLEQIESRTLQGGIGQQEVKRVRIERLGFLGKLFDDGRPRFVDG